VVEAATGGIRRFPPDIAALDACHPCPSQAGQVLTDLNREEILTK